MKIKKMVLLLFAISFMLTACDVENKKSEPTLFEKLVGYYEKSETYQDGDHASGNGEKTVITLYKTGISYTLPELIMEFNKQSDKYEVVLEESDEALDNAEYFANARLLSGNAPDLIMIDAANYEIYKEAKVLADLRPFMQQSNVIKENNQLEIVIDCFREGDCLYGLPLQFTLQTLATKKSCAGNLQKSGQKQSYKGCTVDSFLDWIEQNPELKVQFDGNGMGILLMCLQKNVKDFIDYDNNLSKLQGDAFRNLADRTKSMDFDTNFFDIEAWGEIVSGKDAVLSEESVWGFYTIRQLDLIYSGDLLCFGYPTKDGSMQTLLCPQTIMGITDKSKHKEGAWEFLEYYYSNFSPDAFPVSKPLFEKAYNEAREVMATAKNEYRNPEEYLDMTLELILAAKPADTRDQQILNILEEELSGYYFHNRSFETVSEIVQSRVQLFLWEY